MKEWHVVLLLKLTILSFDHLSEDRQLFEEGITALGLVSFENKLKDDTNESFAELYGK